MLKLAHKGLLIVLLPVVFETAFLFRIQELLQDIDTQITQETLSAQELVHVQGFICDMGRANCAAIAVRGLGDPKYRKEHDDAMSSMANHARALMEATKADQQAHTIVIMLIRSQSMMAAMRRSMMNDTDEPDPRVSDLFGGEFFAKIMTIGGGTKIGSGADRIITDRKREVEGRARVQEARTQKTLHDWLIGGALISCLLTFATALLFHRGVYSRLRQILSNIDRMLRHVQLQPPSKGTDEIAVLDSAVFDTANSIAQLEKFRAETAELMAEKLNEPLRKVADGISHLKASGFENLNDKGKERLNIAGEQVQRLQLLLRDLMSLDKMTEARLQLHMTDCNLRDITRGAREATAALADKRNILLTFDVADLPVRCDEARITQVVINLISNAIKFSPDNSTVEIAGYEEGKFACITVLDHGRGIDPDFQTKLFHRFEQAAKEDQSKGSGLGLAISRELVEAHGGTTTFESEPGRTKFRIKFPIQSMELARDPQAPRSIAQKDGRLWRKGLVLLAIPLAIQLSVVGTLYYMVERANQQMENVRQSREIAYYAEDASAAVIENFMCALMYNATSSESMLSTMKLNQPQLARDLGILQNLQTAGDPDAKKPIEDLSKLVKTCMDTSQQLIDAPPNMTLKEWFKKYPATTQISQRIGQVSDDIQVWVDKSSRREADQLASDARSRATMLGVLRVGLLISVVASMLIALMFTNNLCARIGRIVQNAKRLRSNEPLVQPSAESRDEISTVDTELFAAAEHLRQLDRFRQELLSVTSHELRTPLTALLGNFDILGTGMYGTPTEEGAKLLDETREECAALVASITQFLDEEKARAGKLLTMDALLQN